MVVKASVEVDANKALHGLEATRKGARIAIRRIANQICLEVKEQVITNTLRGGVFKSKGVLNDLRIYMSHQNPERVGETGMVYGIPRGGKEASEVNGITHKMDQIGLFFERGTHVVKPVRSGIQYLRIPLPPALTPKGYDREAGVQLSEEKETSPYFAFRSKKGNVLLGMRGKGTLPYYLLRKTVTIKGRGWFEKAVKQVKSRLSTIVPKEFRKYINVERT